MVTFTELKAWLQPAPCAASFQVYPALRDWLEDQMHYFTYILWSETLQKYYTGHSQYRYKRQRQHRQPSNLHWTDGAQDWEEIWHCKLDSRTEAAALERKIKNRGAKRFLQDLKSRD